MGYGQKWLEFRRDSHCRKEIADGIDVQTWLTGKVSDVIAVSLSLEAVADIPIFNRIRELNKRDMMEVYQCLEQNN